MATRYFRLKDDAGSHFQRSDKDGGILEYRPGDTIASEKNLMALFPNKFKEVNPKSPRAKDRYEDGHDEDDLIPVRGLPTKRTRRPLGPEETPNTEEEIFEVDKAMEDEDTEENPQTFRGNTDRNMEGQGSNKPKLSKRLLKHQKKMGRISDEDEPEEVDLDSEYDEDDDVEDQYNKFAPVKGKTRTKESGRPKGEEEEDDDTIESDDDDVVAEDDSDEEEAPKKKVKSGKKKKKSKKNRE